MTMINNQISSLHSSSQPSVFIKEPVITRKYDTGMAITMVIVGIVFIIASTTLLLVLNFSTTHVITSVVAITAGLFLTIMGIVTLVKQYLHKKNTNDQEKNDAIPALLNQLQVIEKEKKEAQALIEEKENVQSVIKEEVEQLSKKLLISERSKKNLILKKDILEKHISMLNKNKMPLKKDKHTQVNKDGQHLSIRAKKAKKLLKIDYKVICDEKKKLEASLNSTQQVLKQISNLFNPITEDQETLIQQVANFKNIIRDQEKQQNQSFKIQIEDGINAHVDQVGVAFRNAVQENKVANENYHKIFTRLKNQFLQGSVFDAEQQVTKCQTEVAVARYNYENAKSVPLQIINDKINQLNSAIAVIQNQLKSSEKNMPVEGSKEFIQDISGLITKLGNYQQEVSRYQNCIDNIKRQNQTLHVDVFVQLPKHDESKKEDEYLGKLEQSHINLKTALQELAQVKEEQLVTIKKQPALKKAEETRKKSAYQLDIATTNFYNTQKLVSILNNIFSQESVNIMKEVDQSLDLFEKQLKQQKKGLQHIFFEMKGLEDKQTIK
ncbi:hypothetical protein CLAVI_000673 [Candidatus Clavichlamydia salmonicola]|uniref:hypothetical protein n=1 Tax=Candidatus Clavichlamydia salmonicola TaxID=469812 RepID=UPI0018916259|nr:hypothetical protein [Candidatus Clavichlamydia salmonicola]MBF5051045.1 hypothetical protein [Candidatus Clavichlamydia salmonicola]